jgi:asparagine synthase (glutamine-hydrolysing)
MTLETLLPFKDAIKRQTVSDVPLCSFLSGGLDSSAIAALSGVGHTFSVDYDENARYFKANAFQPNSDAEYINQMTDFLGTEHTNTVVGIDELTDALFEAAEARDLPGMSDVDSSLLLFCRAVKQHATVALSGECADEIFGGYPWYRDEKTLNTDYFPWSQSTSYRAGFLKKEFLHKIGPGGAEKYVYQKYKDTVNSAPFSETDSEKEKRMKQMFRLNIDWFMQTLLERKVIEIHKT